MIKDPLYLSVLTRELVAVDGFTTGTVATGEVTTLEHELGDHSVEHGAFVPKVLGLGTLLASAQNSGSKRKDEQPNLSTDFGGR